MAKSELTRRRAPSEAPVYTACGLTVMQPQQHQRVRNGVT